MTMIQTRIEVRVERLPRFDEIDSDESQGNEQANTTNYDINLAQEIILATNPSCRRNHQLLLPIETVSIVIVLYHHFYNLINFEISFNSAV